MSAGLALPPPVCLPALRRAKLADGGGRLLDEGVGGGTPGPLTALADDEGCKWLGVGTIGAEGGDGC